MVPAPNRPHNLFPKSVTKLQSAPASAPRRKEMAGHASWLHRWIAVVCGRDFDGREPEAGREPSANLVEVLLGETLRDVLHPSARPDKHEGRGRRWVVGARDSETWIVDQHRAGGRESVAGGR